MIQFLTGIPGSGKGVVCMRYIRDDILNSYRSVITDLPVDLPKFQTYLQDKFGWDGDLNNRLLVLKADEAVEFYRYRLGYTMPRVENAVELSKRDKSAFLIACKEAFNIQDDFKGVQYYIDEAHLKFDSREWQTTGPILSFYASQHRHMEDNVLFMSQNPEQVEGRLRMLAQARWEVRNFYVEKLGPFRRRGCFKVAGHYRCPKTLSGTPFETYSFQLDKNLADCYKTTGAISPQGEGKPESPPKKTGMPWWMLYAAFAAAIAVVGLAVMNAPAMMSWVVRNTVGAVKDGAIGGLRGEAGETVKEQVEDVVPTGNAALPESGYPTSSSSLPQGTRPTRHETAPAGTP